MRTTRTNAVPLWGKEPLSITRRKMSEIHNISEGSIVEVTDMSGGPSTIDGLQVGKDEIIPQLQEGVRFEVRSIKEKVRTNKVIVNLFPVEGQGIPTYKSVSAATYESWPNGCSHGHQFDADGHITHYADKYFDVEVIA